MLLIGFIAGCSNKKDLIYSNQALQIVDGQTLVNRFLQVPTDANEDVKKIIANIAETERATPFLANYAAKFGMPEWKYMFGNKNKLPTPSQSNSSNYATLGSSTAGVTDNDHGFYFIPLTDPVTKRTKAFIYCQQFSQTFFTYRTYDIDAILAANTITDSAKLNKNVALGFAAYFERQINGSVLTNAFQNNKYSNVSIRMVDTNENTKSTNSDKQNLSFPSCSRTVNVLIEYDLGEGRFEYEVVAVTVSVPCESGGGGGVVTLPPPNLGGGGTVNPPPPPSTPPATNYPPNTTPPPAAPPTVTPPPASNPPTGGSYPGYTPPSGGSYPGYTPPTYGGGGIGGGSYPSNGYQYGPYLPPNYWDIWNPNDPILFPGRGYYSQLGLADEQMTNLTDSDPELVWWDDNTSDPNTIYTPQPKPSFANMYANYPKDANNNDLPLPDVCALIGGQVKSKYDGGNIENACALRVSRALNYSGVVIPNISGQTLIGADGKNYFYYAQNLYNWMGKTFGQADIHKTAADGAPNGTNFKNQLIGLQNRGIYIMKPISQQAFGASGHATLWGGLDCIGGHNYFNAASDVYIWILN